LNILLCSSALCSFISIKSSFCVYFTHVKIMLNLYSGAWLPSFHANAFRPLNLVIPDISKKIRLNTKRTDPLVFSAINDFFSLLRWRLCVA
jgi:hypothetical protein